MSKDRLYQGPIFVKKSPIHGYGVFAVENLVYCGYLAFIRGLQYLSS